MSTLCGRGDSLLSPVYIWQKVKWRWPRPSPCPWVGQACTIWLPPHVQAQHWKGAEHRVHVQACAGGGPEPCGFHAEHFSSQSPCHCDLAEEALRQVTAQFVLRYRASLLKPFVCLGAPLKNGRSSGPIVSLSKVLPLAGWHFISCSLHLKVMPFYQHSQLPGLVPGAQMLCRVDCGLAGLSLMKSTAQALLWKD